jgi:hypothetical protein
MEADSGAAAATTASSSPQQLELGKVLRIEGDPCLLIGLRWWQKPGLTNTVCDLDCGLVLFNGEAQQLAFVDACSRQYIARSVIAAELLNDAVSTVSSEDDDLEKLMIDLAAIPQRVLCAVVVVRSISRDFTLCRVAAIGASCTNMVYNDNTADIHSAATAAAARTVSSGEVDHNDSAITAPTGLWHRHQLKRATRLFSMLHSLDSAATAGAVAARVQPAAPVMEPLSTARQQGNKHSNHSSSNHNSSSGHNSSTNNSAPNVLAVLKIERKQAGGPWAVVPLLHELRSSDTAALCTAVAKHSRHTPPTAAARLLPTVAALCGALSAKALPAMEAQFRVTTGAPGRRRTGDLPLQIILKF